MTTKPNADASINKEGEPGTNVPPGAMHRPHHGAQDMEDIATHDEAQHDAALRESSLRVPR
ncbi:MAG TPA: hypothetical protein VL997_15460 [Dyella sp.]|nr:hypothetical protein [Dyella sp.]